MEKLFITRKSICIGSIQTGSSTLNNILTFELWHQRISKTARISFSAPIMILCSWDMSHLFILMYAVEVLISTIAYICELLSFDFAVLLYAVMCTLSDIVSSIYVHRTIYWLVAWVMFILVYISIQLIAMISSVVSKNINEKRILRRFCMWSTRWLIFRKHTYAGHKFFTMVFGSFIRLWTDPMDR